MNHINFDGNIANNVGISAAALCAIKILIGTIITGDTSIVISCYLCYVLLQFSRCKHDVLTRIIVLISVCKRFNKFMIAFIEDT